MKLKRDGINWEHDETVLALELYFRTPYGSIHARNPEIIQLATLLQRKPDAVVFKMGNLARLDPELRASGRKGLSNGAKIDKEVFDEYYQKWNELALDSEYFRECMISDLNDSQIKPQYNLINLKVGSEKEIRAKIRVGQAFFHNAVCSEYNYRCCITGLGNSKLVQAAHIKPWKDCDPNEKTSPNNGICLNPLHHKLFDEGRFTLDDEFRIIISDSLKKEHMDEDTKDWIWSYNNKQIELPSRYYPDIKFIHYHRDNIFLR